ncbi:MAG: glycosyltransferase family 2 protein [Chlorobiaceae bacterium]|nr:glycosyltransferase family 2 protein [Chlorobiaceae bacterium]
MRNSNPGKVTAPVSVVIPCYCCAEVLERAVNSVLHQLLLPEEIILVDDASPDGGQTRSCISRLQSLYGGSGLVTVTPVFLSVNMGPGGARNAGWAVATQEYVAFLDSDDSWHRDKLAVQVSWMELHPDVSFSGNQLVYGDMPADMRLDGNVTGAAVTLRKMIFKNRLLTSTVMVRRNVGQRFLPGERYSEDYSLWLRLLADGCDAVVLELPLARAHRAPFSQGGVSSALWKMEQSELQIYRSLVEKKQIGMAQALLAALFSLFKFIRRMVLSQRRQHSSCVA